MSIADKLIAIAANEQKVYNAGYAKGKAEGGGDVTDRYDEGFVDGRKAEYDAFWDGFQNNGTRTSYAHAFRTGWRDSIYNPKYPIVCNGNNTANSAFAFAGISDTKVPITIKGNNGSVFPGASNIVTIHKLIVDETTTSYNDWFTSCSKLANIEFEGEIVASINFNASPLTAKSLVSIVEHLSPTATGKTLTVKSSAVSNADWSTTEYESWAALVDTKSNWSFTLA